MSSLLAGERFREHLAVGRLGLLLRRASGVSDAREDPPAIVIAHRVSCQGFEWQPEARGRVEQAAFALYGERGYDHTTVAEIAERPGLTERTFFRHFADKREVLFAGSGALQELLVGAVSQERPDFSRQRQAIIAASAELRERELGVTVAIRRGIRCRGRRPARQGEGRPARRPTGR